MAPQLPIVLVGENLGERHHQFNFLVNEAYKSGDEFANIKNMPEKSQMDRLFKIELALKKRDVDYVLNTLKDEDMLYVSTALKSNWLLDVDYSGIINPTYLDDVLYPQMRTTAISKMKNWISKYLKDPQRTQQFYLHYRDINFEEAFKFLWKCSKYFIMTEAPKILEKMTPRRLKLLAEKCPEVVKIYFDSFQSNETVLSNYISNSREYYKNLQFLLKVDTDLFLDITEKYYERHFGRFKSTATKYIMKNKKDRFHKKPELYTAYFLETKILAKYLDEGEIKELLLKLARASYLQYWFSYKEVAPLIKTIDVKERSAFKKRIFVEKSFDDAVDEWPYEIPKRPQGIDNGANVFEDVKDNPNKYSHLDSPKRLIQKRKFGKYQACSFALACPPLACNPCIVRKSSLDQLFDRLRFVPFEKALFDLRKQMRVETTKHRQNMMLVLLSKSGGRPESIQQLLEFLTTHYENEAENVRATIIRSLVRRCSAWRLPPNVWELVLKFGQGIGLDGKPSTVACSEGIHAVIIRNILLDNEINEAIWKAYLKDFSALSEYSLSGTEKQKISSKLPSLLLASVKNDPGNATEVLELTLRTLDTYKIRADQCPGLVATVAAVAKNDSKAESIIRQLYSAKVARKELFKENFALIQTEESYLNALKHDTSVLSTGEKFETIIKSNEFACDRFLKKLFLYFNEKDGLAHKYTSLLRRAIEESQQKKLARPFAILSGTELVDMMGKFDDTPKNSKEKRFAAELRANAHLVRPYINTQAIGWESMGAKAVANKVLICNLNSVEENIENLLKHGRTQRLAFVLSLRIGKEAKTLEKISTKRPRCALKMALCHSGKKDLDKSVWDIIISLITTLDITGEITDRLRKALSNIKPVPKDKKPKYCVAVYEVFKKVSKYAPLPMLCNIGNILPEIEEGFIEKVVKNFLDQEFTFENEKSEYADYGYDRCIELRARVIAKYLLLCKSEEELERRWESVGEPFLKRAEEIWNKRRDVDVMRHINIFIESLSYMKAFMDTKYEFCLPMFERLVNRLQKFVPIHKYCAKYIELHLTMLYFKSVRQAIKNNPVVFENLPNSLELAAEAVGRIFGAFVAREVIELTEKYFDSIRVIYKDSFSEYLNKYFQREVSFNILVANIMRGILDCDNAKPYLLVVFVLKEYQNDIAEKDTKELLEALKGNKDMEVRYYVNAYC